MFLKSINLLVRGGGDYLKKKLAFCVVQYINVTWVLYVQEKTFHKNAFSNLFGLFFQKHHGRCISSSVSNEISFQSENPSEISIPMKNHVNLCRLSVR